MLLDGSTWILFNRREKRRISKRVRRGFGLFLCLPVYRASREGKWIERDLVDQNALILLGRI